MSRHLTTADTLVAALTGAKPALASREICRDLLQTCRVFCARQRSRLTSEGVAAVQEPRGSKRNSSPASGHAQITNLQNFPDDQPSGPTRVSAVRRPYTSAMALPRGRPDAGTPQNGREAEQSRSLRTTHGQSGASSELRKSWVTAGVTAGIRFRHR